MIMWLNVCVVHGVKFGGVGDGGPFLRPYLGAHQVLLSDPPVVPINLCVKSRLVLQHNMERTDGVADGGTERIVIDGRG